MVSLPAFLAGAPSGSWVRQAENVCFSANARLDREIFESRSSGFVGGVRFEHVSGGVSGCASCSPTKFGGFGKWLMTTLVSEAKDTLMYSTSMTDGITGLNHLEAGYGFDGYSMNRIDDSTLTPTQPTYSVQCGEKFRVEYIEVFKNEGLFVNSGTSCVAVYFLFLSFHDDWSSPLHNLTDESALPVSFVNVLTA